MASAWTDTHKQGGAYIIVAHTKKPQKGEVRM